MLVAERAEAILRTCRKNHGSMAFLHVGAGMDAETARAIELLREKGLVTVEDKPAPVSGSPGGTVVRLTRKGLLADGAALLPS